MKTLTELQNFIPGNGTVTWIGVRPARREPVVSVRSTRALIGLGLEGDRRTSGKHSPDADRLVTLIQEEHLPAIASLLMLDDLDPALLRRNIVVKGINLLALKNQQFKIGDAILEGTGPCPPCSRMEEVLGAGGYNAMRGHGGITAKVIQEGEIDCGDDVGLMKAGFGNLSD